MDARVPSKLASSLSGGERRMRTSLLSFVGWFWIWIDWNQYCLLCLFPFMSTESANGLAWNNRLAIVGDKAASAAVAIAGQSLCVPYTTTLAVIIEIRSMSASVIACNWLNYNRPPSTIDHHRGGGLCIYCSLQINLSPPDRTVPGYGRTTNNLCTMAMGNCGLCFHFTSYTICSRIPSFKQEKGKLGKVELALGSTDCVLLNGLLGSR